MRYQEKLSDAMRKQRFRGTPSGEDELRGALRRARGERAKREKPAPAGADEMWLLGGPEHTEQGGFALASARKRRRKAIAKIRGEVV